MKNSDRFYKKNVIITGASSGIGKEIAFKFAELNANLFLIARNIKKLESTKDEIRNKFSKNNLKIEIFSGDISNCERMEEIVKEIGENHGGIHTLINNAGVVGLGLIEENTIEELKEVMEINYWGAVYLTKFCLPYIKKEKGGHIGFVSSVAGYLGLIGYGSYSPSKFALTGFAECLRMEAGDYGIGVTIVFPPDTATPMLEYEHQNTLPECKALSKNAKIMTPQEVAEKFIQGILKYKFEVICNFESKFIKIFKNLFPKFYYKLVDNIVFKDRKKRGVKISGIYSH